MGKADMHSRWHTLRCAQICDGIFLPQCYPQILYSHLLCLELVAAHHAVQVPASDSIFQHLCVCTRRHVILSCECTEEWQTFEQAAMAASFEDTSSIKNCMMRLVEIKKAPFYHVDGFNPLQDNPSRHINPTSMGGCRSFCVRTNVRSNS